MGSVGVQSVLERVQVKDKILEIQDDDGLGKEAPSTIQQQTVSMNNCY